MTATARLRVLPDIPLIGDVVPGYAVTGWLGIGVPKGTPAEIVERLNREINAALADPTVKARMAELGSEIFIGSPADFAKLVAEETEKWAKVVNRPPKIIKNIKERAKGTWPSARPFPYHPRSRGSRLS